MVAGKVDAGFVFRGGVKKERPPRPGVVCICGWAFATVYPVINAQR